MPSSALVMDFATEKLIPGVSIPKPGVVSALLRSLGVEVGKHWLDALATTLGTMWVRLRMLGDVLTEFENFPAFAAAIFVNRHRRYLQAEYLWARSSPP